MSHFSRVQFLAQQDLINERPPRTWLEGLPLGNGHLGVVAWGGVREWHLTLDRIDLWDLRWAEPDDPRWGVLLRNGPEGAWRSFLERNPGAPRKLAAGRWTLELVGLPSEVRFRERLALHPAMATRCLEQGDRTLRLDLWVQATRPLVCVRLGPQNLARQLHLSLVPPGPAETLGWPAPERGTDGPLAWLRQALPDGREYVVAYSVVQGQRLNLPGPEVRLELPGRPATWLYLTLTAAGEGQDPLETARAVLEEAVTAGLETLEHQHRGWWYDFWSRSWVSLADRRLENLWYMELYKLASTSRPGHLPAGLQGVWSPEDGENPGRGGYFPVPHLSQTYWPAYAANHLELAQPLMDWLHALRPQWREMARRAWGCDGVALPPATDPRGRWLPVRLSAPSEAGAEVWMAHLFWQHWKYSQDRDFLGDRAYPFLKACSEFWEAWMAREGRPCPLNRGLLKFLWGAAADASEVLDVDAPARARWRSLQQRLPPYPEDRGGSRSLWDLAPIYPFGEWNLEGTPEEVALAQAWLEELVAQGHGQWPGWVFPWAAGIGARLGWKNLAAHLLDLYLEAFIQPNTFHVNVDYRRLGVSAWSSPSPALPFTLEAGFAAAAAVNEMLLQSWGGKIRLFPGLPEEWDASFHGLRAEGAFRVSAVKERGQVRYLSIQSIAGGTCRLVNPWSDGRVQLQTGEALQVGGRVLTFETEPGREYRLENDRHSDPHLQPWPVAGRRGESGPPPFGLRAQ